MLEIPAFNLEDDSSDYGDFRQCQVSPVPTPVLQRPMTREQTRMSHEDKVSDILRGYLVSGRHFLGLSLCVPQEQVALV
jgi:hypothetical protein